LFIFLSPSPAARTRRLRTKFLFAELSIIVLVEPHQRTHCTTNFSPREFSITVTIESHRDRIGRRTLGWTLTLILSRRGANQSGKKKEGKRAGFHGSFVVEARESGLVNRDEHEASIPNLNEG
jgi:hypothetical protein